NRSAIGTWPTPANICDRSLRPAGRQLIQRTPLPLMTSLAALRRLTQAISEGGASPAAQTAEHVRPASPAGPLVAITETAVVRPDKAVRNSGPATDSTAPPRSPSAGAVMTSSAGERGVIAPVAYAYGGSYTIHPWISSPFHLVMQLSSTCIICRF